MNRYIEKMENQFPTRRKRGEKEAFRKWLCQTLDALGYKANIETNMGLVHFGDPLFNVTVGDVKTAKIILTAHYDTGAKNFFPEFYCPTRPLTYFLYQAIQPILAIVLCFLLSFAINYPLRLPGLMFPLFLLFFFALLVYSKWGPSEKKNANRSTSGVAALLETAEKISPRYRGEVAFAFLDGSQGKRGAKTYRKRYPEAREKTVIHLVCVGCGEEILILPGKYARWDGILLDAVNENFYNTERKTCFLKADGLTLYPSDNRAFKYATVICACHKINGFGRIVKQDCAEIDDENLSILSDGLAKTVAAYHK